MTNKKFLLVFGIIAIMMAYVFNMNHAVDNYGITRNNMSIHVLAQDTTNNGGGSTSEGNSGGTTEDVGNGECTLATGCLLSIKICLGTVCSWESVKGTKIDCTDKNCPPKSSCYSTDKKPCHQPK